MDARDVVIGAITGYTFKQIAPWVNSLDRSGFTGRKVVIVYNADFDTVAELASRGYEIVAFHQDDLLRRFTYPKNPFSTAIVVERFCAYHMFLNQQPMGSIRYVIATDVRDVVFQSNPSTYLESLDPFLNHQLIVSSECLQYQHEEWGANNLSCAFGPLMYDLHKGHTIYNCGVLAGRAEHFSGLSKTLYLMSQIVPYPHVVPGGGGPDQAALNILLSTQAYSKHTCFTNHEYEWAAQLGTMMDPRKLASYAPHFIDPHPRFDVETGSVVNPRNIPYVIVHQWDRVPEVKTAFERKYAA